MTVLSNTCHFMVVFCFVAFRNILDDPEASNNDRFVALTLLKNANIAAGMVLPGCQDTGMFVYVYVCCVGVLCVRVRVRTCMRAHLC